MKTVVGACRHQHLVDLCSDEGLTDLVGAATPLGSGIGGRSSLLEVDGTPVFIKRVPLTDLERLPENVRSTLGRRIAGTPPDRGWYGSDDRDALLRAYAQGARLTTTTIPEAAAAILSRYAPLATVLKDFNRKLRHETRQTPYPLEEIRRVSARYSLSLT